MGEVRHAVMDIGTAGDHLNAGLTPDFAVQQRFIQKQQLAADAALAIDPIQLGGILARADLHQKVPRIRGDGQILRDSGAVGGIEGPDLLLGGHGGEGIGRFRSAAVSLGPAAVLIRFILGGGGPAGGQAQQQQKGSQEGELLFHSGTSFRLSTDDTANIAGENRESFTEL